MESVGTRLLSEASLLAIKYRKFTRTLENSNNSDNKKF